MSLEAQAVYVLLKVSNQYIQLEDDNFWYGEKLESIKVEWKIEY